MSLQRVLEIARKNGMPVIITDNSGREPMVILPLEQFEALSYVPGPTSSDSSGPRTQDLRPTAKDHELENAIAEMAVERAKSRMEDAARQLEDLTDPESSDEEAPLEERFYVEPLDDR